MSSPFLSRDGAVAGDPPDAGVPAHYGSPIAEQRALIRGEAVVDLSHRDVFEVAGSDRLSWLHALTTQHLEGLAPNQYTEVLVLSPQGKIEHGFCGFDDGQVFIGHAEPGAAEPLLQFLDRLKFFNDVELRSRPDLAVIGRMASNLPSYEVVGRDQLSDVAQSVPAAAGLWAWEALRIERGLVRIGRDTDDRTIPNEAGLIERAVHLDKGCYRGQETVAKVHTLGKPPRRLVRLMLDGSVDHLPAEGSSIEIDGRVVGRVGTSARHHELGPIALALIKRGVDPGTEIVVDSVAAAQEVIVDPEVGLHIRPALG